MAANGARGDSRSRRWGLRLWRREPRPEGLDPARPDLQVVAAGFDDAEASSTALERAAAGDPRWTADAQVVLRHYLLLPAGQVGDAVAVAGQDGYQPAADPTPVIGAEAGAEAGAGVGAGALAEAVARVPRMPDARLLALQRVQVLDALHCSQERSRMAGLAQRRDGVALGWEALQPAPPDPAP